MGPLEERSFRGTSAVVFASGAASLIAGLWAGLARIGWSLPVDARLVAAHGPLMVVGFFATVIGLERAVAHGRGWPFVAPMASAAAAIGSCCGLPFPWPALLVIAAGAVMIAIVASAMRRHASLFLFVSALGAFAFAIAGLVWLSGAPLFHVVPWWSAFIVLTVTGERLELTRLLPASPAARRAFVVVLAAYLVSLGARVATPDLGARARGVALIAIAAWLARCDVARRTIRLAGLSRYTASCLLAGYGWLAIAGALGAVFGDVAVGPRYDAVTHALFVGFAFSMLFGHAPLVLPAVVGIRVSFVRVLYAPVALLHLARCAPRG